MGWVWRTKEWSPEESVRMIGWNSSLFSSLVALCLLARWQARALVSPCTKEMESWQRYIRGRRGPSLAEAHRLLEYYNYIDP